MKEKFEKVLRDARARELMYAEREAILDKELNKEKVKAAAALKSLQEKLEEKLKMELEQKEAAAALELKTMQELGKAELALAVASEKASHNEKMAEANLNAALLGANSHRFLQTDSCEADSELLMNDGCATDGQIIEGGSQDELEVLDLSSFCFVLFFQVNLLFFYAIV